MSAELQRDSKTEMPTDKSLANALSARRKYDVDGAETCAARRGLPEPHTK